MENIHMPAVPSGPRSEAQANGNGEGHKSIFELMAEKDRIESELSALSDVLDSHGVDMNTSLTDRDGFPRSDIDVAQVRTTRARAIRLRNDHKAIMARIEPALHEHFAKAREAGVDPAPIPNGTTGSTAASAALSRPRVVFGGTPDNELSLRPFAKVNSVVVGSPADTAGLKAGDEILRFGDVDRTSPDQLARVAAVTGRNEGREIKVRILRKASSGSHAQHMELSLTPRSNWGGRGTLGCHILAL